MDAPACYADFLAAKAPTDPPTGMADPGPVPDAMKPHQRDITRWALRRGRAAVFAGTGLGKTLIELEWGRQVAAHTGLPVLVLAPLAVARQHLREGPLFGLDCRPAAEARDIEGPRVHVTNYDRLDRFDMAAFGGVALDESSILKAYDGATRNALIARCRQVPFRLAASATPAPNDFMELGNHAEFLGVMSYAEMLAMFFTHDGGETQKWRLKGHAAGDFWSWMASWAVMLRKPSDLGYPDDGYDLPPLEQVEHLIPAGTPAEGMLFAMQARTLPERLAARRATVKERCRLAAEIIAAKPADPWVAWCNLNDEADLITRLVPGARQVRGADSPAAKEAALADFAEGRLRVLVTKPSIAGWGMNWQHCADTVFVGLNDSFEQVYQAVRRFWRFGQTRPVTAHFIASEIEGAVVDNLRRKQADAERMAEAMVAHMKDLNAAALAGMARQKADYRPAPARLPSFMEDA